MDDMDLPPAESDYYYGNDDDEEEEDVFADMIKSAEKIEINESSS